MGELAPLRTGRQMAGQPDSGRPTRKRYRPLDKDTVRWPRFRYALRDWGWRDGLARGEWAWDDAAPPTPTEVPLTEVASQPGAR